MTGPEQNRNARPDERARWDERGPDGRGPDGRVPDGRARQRYEEPAERARDERDRQRYDRERQQYERERRQYERERRRYEGRGDGVNGEQDRDRDREEGREAEQGDEWGRERGQEGRGWERERAREREQRSADGSGRPRGPLLGEYAPPYRRRSGRVAAVLLYRNGGHRVVWPDRNEDVNKPMLGSPYTVFEVQLGRNVTEFRLQLPAAGDGVFFEALARVQWVVTDPHLVVQEQVEDVAELLHDELLDRLRRLSRRFRITEAQRADEAVREELSAGRLVLGRDIGLKTRVHVFIDLDDSVKAEIHRRDRIGVTMEADAREAEAERRRDEAERVRVADRAREMEALFRRGDLAQIAHHMAMHPDKQWEIRTQLQRERREGQEDYLAVFNRLLDTGVLERHDIGEQMYQVLMYLRTQTSNVVGGITDHVLNPSGGAGPRARRALEEGLPEPSRPDWDDEHGESRGRGEGRETRETRDTWESREARESREAQEAQETREARERGERADDPPERRVYEPTRVESGSDRERERGRGRDRDRDGYGDGYGERGRRDGGHDRYEADDPYDRSDPYERNDRSDRGDRSDRDERYDRFDRDDPYDRGDSDRSRRSARPIRPARPSSEFDDWDDA
ncbi:hypothetical protein OG361_30270 [Streptomyces sp. NBC_00090]|uniref:hypothetical protein n=1 Tax=Streptomyces sp. NBC_00090 TaxID=2903619 RepID=UPI003254A3B9